MKGRLGAHRWRWNLKMSDLGVPELTLPEKLDVRDVLEVVTRALEGQERDSEYLKGM